MAAAQKLPRATERHIDDLVKVFSTRKNSFAALLEALTTSMRLDQELFQNVHSIKYRVKDPEHLRDKLRRKAINRPSVVNRLSEGTLFRRITDLAGCRILHLYTEQFETIHGRLLHLFSSEGYDVIEHACARTWDDESRGYFRSLGVRTISSKSLYTSVHYVVSPNRSVKVAAEIQVRTLAEELWGEVDHMLNYPAQSQSLACREQIRALARTTSACTRLVDSIMRTHRAAGTTGH